MWAVSQYKAQKTKMKVGENKQGLYVGWQGDVATKGHALCNLISIDLRGSSVSLTAWKVLKFVQKRYTTIRPETLAGFHGKCNTNDIVICCNKRKWDVRANNAYAQICAWNLCKNGFMNKLWFTKSFVLKCILNLRGKKCKNNRHHT